MSKRTVAASLLVAVFALTFVGGASPAIAERQHDHWKQGPWGGPTSDLGQRVTFHVNGDHQVKSAKFGATFTGDWCAFSLQIKVQGQWPIAHGQFTIRTAKGSAHVVIRGRFSSGTEAEGTIDAALTDGGCAGTALARWSADRYQ